MTSTTTPAPDARRWAALAFVSLAQLMIALDATIVNVALPSVQRALAFSDVERQWAVAAYALAFGSLLLLGGRLADRLGRRRAFLAGLIGFAAASALGGAAPAFGTLVAARALQGAFAAMLSPAALSLIAVTFTEPADRAKAFAVYGAIAGSGGAAGLVLGGVLAQTLGWRFCLYVNVAIAAVAFAGARAVLDGRPEPPRSPGVVLAALDVPGAVLATAGLLGVVVGVGGAVVRGWAAPSVVIPLGAGLLLLVLFVAQERRAPQPLLPLSVVADRNRGGACLSAALAIAGMSGLFLLLTFHFQVVLRYTPLSAGLAFLPMTLSVLASSALIASRLLPRVPPRVLMAPGLLVAAIGVAMLTGVGVDSSYLGAVLPAEMVVGVGMGCVMVPAFSVATSGVDRRDAGVASAVVTTAQQIGGALGVALLNSVAASAASAAAASATRAEAMVAGLSRAAGCASAIFIGAAMLAAVMIDAPRPRRP